MATQAYTSIDPLISEWVTRHHMTLFDRVEGGEDSFRLVYVSSPSGECCKIWIDPPQGDQVLLHAAAIESRADEEWEAEWAASRLELDTALENALRSVHQWFAREAAS